MGAYDCDCINNLEYDRRERKAQLSKEGTTKGATSDLISRMETVEHLRRVLDATVPITDYDEGYVDGVEFGISTVSTMPTIQPQSTTGQLNDGAQSTAQSTDLIDRQAVIDELRKFKPEIIPYEKARIYVEKTVETMYDRIVELPTIQPVATDTNVGSNSVIPNSSDAVSRQAAIDECNKRGAEHIGYAIAHLPSRQPEPQWISVSERLPEGYADVLCCNKYADMMIGMIYENSASNTRFSVESDAEIMHDVIAWMPLPESYKPNK